MRRWSSAIVLGVVASVLIAIPASAGDGEAPERHQVRAQEQVQEDECAGDCDPVREQERSQVRSEAKPDDPGCVGDCAVSPEQRQTRSRTRAEVRTTDPACSGDCDPDRDRVRDQDRMHAPSVEEIRTLLTRIRACLVSETADCPDPAVAAKRIRLMLAEEDSDFPGLCIRMWHWWRVAL